MVENKTNWNTVFIVLVIGVVGVLLLSNTNLLSGLVTKKSTISEEVTCVFDSEGISGTENMQKCYAMDGKWGCSGAGSCTTKVSGEKGQKLKWQSSCGSVGLITTIDGIDEKIKFACGLPPNPCVINTVCESEFGENEINCPADCASVKADSCDADNVCEVDNLYASGKVSLKAYAGKRNAYACLDAYGTLFRSEKPCPSLLIR